MKTFYVSFGGILLHYHLAVTAKDEAIVRRWMKYKSGLKHWCCVYDEPPEGTYPLTKGESLYYTRAEDIDEVDNG